MDNLQALEAALLSGMGSQSDSLEPLCSIDPTTRRITVPDNVFGVESDEQAKRVYFSVPTVVGDNFDLSKARIQINFRNPNGDLGVYLVKDFTADAKGDATFSWSLRRIVTQYKGIVSFIVCATIPSAENNRIDREWNTTLAQGQVLEGLEVTQEMESLAHDIIGQLILAADETDSAADAAVAQVQDAGTQQKEAIAAKGAEAVVAVQTERATAISAMQTESTTQQTAIENKGQEQLDKIPEVTSLAKDVSKLSEEMANISTILGEDEVVLIDTLSAWEAGRISHIDTNGNVTSDARTDMSHLRLSGIAQYKRIISNSLLENVGDIPYCYFVTLCTSDNKRLGAALHKDNFNNNAISWLTKTDSSIVVDVERALEEYPDADVLYFTRYGTEFNWSVIKPRDTGLLQRVYRLENDAEFILPANTVAVVGHEYNLYFDNVFSGDYIGKYDVQARVMPDGITYRNLGDCLRFTPTVAGNYNLILRLKSNRDKHVVKEYTIPLIVINDTALDRDYGVIYIGDSLTNAAIYPAEIQYNLSGGRIKSIGTMKKNVTIGEQSLSVKHEGRAGWSAYDYTEQAEINGVVNSFWNPSTDKFDFPYYMSSNNFLGAELICIGLGTNGAANTDRTIAAIDEMIASIRNYSASIPIIVSLITPPATQRGWGEKVAGYDTAAEFKADALRLCESYINKYGNKANTDVAELYFHLDRAHDFETKTVQVSARNPKTITVQNNNVHPSVYGYLHFADAYYNRIIYWLTK